MTSRKCRRNNLLLPPTNTPASLETHNRLWNFESLHGQSNYNTWIQNFKNALIFKGWSQLLEEPAYEENSGVKDDASEKRDQKAMEYMYNKIDDEPARLIDDVSTVYEACVILQHHYLDEGFTAILRVQSSFDTTMG